MQLSFNPAKQWKFRYPGFRIAVAILVFILKCQNVNGQIVPSVVFDDDHDLALRRAQSVFNDNPELRLNILNRRVESANDTSKLISLLFQRAFTYQQLKNFEAGLIDFMWADKLVKSTGFKYPVPPLDFTDLYIELESQLYKEFAANETPPPSAKIPSIFETIQFINQKSSSKAISPNFRVLYSYHLQTILFNITLVDPDIKDGVISTRSSIDYANIILSGKSNSIKSEDDDFWLYDSITHDLIDQSNLWNSLSVLTSKEKGASQNQLNPSASKFFKDLIWTMNRLMHRNAIGDSIGRVSVLESKSPLINLLSKQIIISQDTLLSPAAKLGLSDEIISYNDFLFALRLRYAPRSTEDKRIHELDKSIKVQKGITYILSGIVCAFLLTSIYLYVSKKIMQKRNRKLLGELAKGFSDTNDLIIEVIRKRSDGKNLGT